MVFKVATDTESVNPIWSYAKGIVGISILVEFIAGFETMNYWAELAFVGLAIFFTTTEVYTQDMDEYLKVNKLSRSVLVFLGVLALGVGANGIYDNFQDTDPMSVIKDNLYPVFIGFLYVPAIYLLTLYCLYETVYTTLGFYFKESKLKRVFAFFLIFNLCHVIPSRIRQLKKGRLGQLYGTIEYADIYKVLKYGYRTQYDIN